MKTINNITLYVCEHCKKKLILRWAMEKHEEFCSMNPKNHSACSACVHLVEGQTTVYYERNDGGGYREIPCIQKTFTCDKLKKEMYPFKVIRKNLLEKYPETFVGKELMPNVCKEWAYIK